MSRRRACRSSNQSQAPVSGLLGRCGKAASTVAAELRRNGTVRSPRCLDIWHTSLSGLSGYPALGGFNSPATRCQRCTSTKSDAQHQSENAPAPILLFGICARHGTAQRRMGLRHIACWTCLPVSSPRTRPHTAQRLGKLGDLCCWCPGWLGAPSRSTCSTAEGDVFQGPPPCPPNHDRKSLSCTGPELPRLGVFAATIRSCVFPPVPGTPCCVVLRPMSRIIRRKDTQSMGGTVRVSSLPSGTTLELQRAQSPAQRKPSARFPHLAANLPWRFSTTENTPTPMTFRWGRVSLLSLPVPFLDCGVVQGI